MNLYSPLRTMNFHLILGQIERDIGVMQKVIGEVILDYVASITAAEHEVVKPVRGINFHDVPENRLVADFDHRLWLNGTFFADAGAKPTG